MLVETLVPKATVEAVDEPVPPQLPEQVSIRLRAYMKKMNLMFGVFNLIVTPEQKYVFIECNVDGQWLFVERFLDLPISEAMAALFLKAMED